ncbi:hypothetical protein MKX01_016057, partial [Papaver californicum]
PEGSSDFQNEAHKALYVPPPIQQKEPRLFLGVSSQNYFYQGPFAGKARRFE